MLQLTADFRKFNIVGGIICFAGGGTCDIQFCQYFSNFFFLQNYFFDLSIIRILSDLQKPPSTFDIFSTSLHFNFNSLTPYDQQESLQLYVSSLKINFHSPENFEPLTRVIVGSR